MKSGFFKIQLLQILFDLDGWVDGWRNFGNFSDNPDIPDFPDWMKGFTTKSEILSFQNPDFPDFI